MSEHTLHGLSTIEAKHRLERFGENTIEEKKQASLLSLFIDQFRNVFMLLLLIASVVSLSLGEGVDALLIVVIMVLNALFGVYQEKKAGEAVRALRNMTVTNVRVMRDGTEQEIDSRTLVPGDIVYIEEGSKVPADGTIRSGRNIAIDEAALTGESLPVDKEEGDTISMGTVVSKGRGYMEVTSTGMKTRFGAIAQSLQDIVETKTPLQKKLDTLAGRIGYIGIIAATIVFSLEFFATGETFTALLLAIALVVAVVPEGLPAVMTITLAIGMNNLAKKNTIVRKMSAVEALGSTTLICTDKTGTLTQNIMKAAHVWFSGKAQPAHTITTIQDTALEEIVRTGIICSTASLVPVGDHGTSFSTLGDPTEGALLLFAQDVGVRYEAVRSQWKISDEEPFDSVTKRMSMTAQNGSKTVKYIKGAPESVIPHCSYIREGAGVRKIVETDSASLQKTIDDWAEDGLRNLAFAIEEHGKTILVGAIALHDAPRPEAPKAVEKARKAGIRTVMITGDNEKTASAIGRHCGILKKGDGILTGVQVDGYVDEELVKILPTITIFARTTPFQKQRIVKLYQQLGYIVTVTGDGVNDAIALKQADVGAAMGKVGTDVARETADIVITDDNFATIVDAVEEGRNITKHLKHAITYLFTCSIMEAFTVIGALVLYITGVVTIQDPHILYPIQILFINLVTDGLPALALAFAPRNSAIMQGKFNGQSLLSPFSMAYIAVVGFCGTILILASFSIGLSFSEEFARTLAFVFLALMQSYIFVDLWLSHRPLRHHFTLLKSAMFVSAFSVPFAFVGAIVLIPRIAHIFHTVPLSIGIYGALIIASSAVYLGIVGVKLFYNSRAIAGE